MHQKTISLGVITARGGSKAIPRKNIASLAGKPLIAWTIEAAQKSKTLTRLIVSTDDENIAQVARQYGAEVPFMRPADLAQDQSPHIPVLAHALAWLSEHEIFVPEYVLLLQPTSPLRTAEDIDASFELFQQKNADSVIGVSPTPTHPYLVKRMESDGRLESFMPTPDGYLSRQSLPPAYIINGAIYWIRRDVLIEKKTLCTDRTYGYVMPEDRSLDIDTPSDLRLAEYLMASKT